MVKVIVIFIIFLLPNILVVTPCQTESISENLWGLMQPSFTSWMPFFAHNQQYGSTETVSYGD